jgi:hypothetical protein
VAFLKVLGWIFVPYVMIFIQWKRSGMPIRIIGGIWAVIALIVFISTITSDKTSQGINKGMETAATDNTTATETPVQTEDSAIKKADEEKAKLDADKLAKEKAAAKVEAEAKAKEEAKKKENTIDGNGTFAVNDEIKPGIYKSNGKITYYARTSGFSGSPDEILANGTPTGSAIVEILNTDKGFQTTGSGEWVLVDADYKAELLTEFGDGMYFVGKDIVPGTYKSEGVDYWARLNNFTGDMNDIEANGTPSGPEIVEISETDIGFQTSGGGTWKKIK